MNLCGYFEGVGRTSFHDVVFIHVLTIIDILVPRIGEVLITGVTFKLMFRWASLHFPWSIGVSVGIPVGLLVVLVITVIDYDLGFLRT